MGNLEVATNYLTSHSQYPSHSQQACYSQRIPGIFYCLHGFISIDSLVKALPAALKLPTAKKLQRIGLPTVPTDNPSLCLEKLIPAKPTPVKPIPVKPIPVKQVPARTNSVQMHSWMYHQSASILIDGEIKKPATALMPTKLIWDAIKSIQPWQQGWGS
jgi:hypothetical protein